jgi:hypothetical protein
VKAFIILLKFKIKLEAEIYINKFKDKNHISASTSSLTSRTSDSGHEHFTGSQATLK